MKKLLTLMLVVTGIAFGQAKADPTKPVPPPTPARQGDVVKFIELRSTENTNGQVSTLNTLRAMYPAGSGVEMTFDGKTLVVRGPAATLKLIEETAQKLDARVATTTANVEMTMQLLYATSKEDAKGTVTPDLQATVQELRKVFPYTSYRVMDVLLQRGRDGRQLGESGEVSGATPRMTYDISYVPNIGPNAASRTVRLSSLRVNLITPSGGQRLTITTDLDAREGQKTVVGKMNFPGTEDAIFLVVSPKVIQ